MIEESPKQIFDKLASMSNHENSECLLSLMEDKETELFAKYEDMKKQVTLEFGDPNYSGQGPNGGVEIPALRAQLIFYSSIIEVSFWKKGNCLYLLTVTGHDANSLLCLNLTTRRLD